MLTLTALMGTFGRATGAVTRAVGAMTFGLGGMGAPFAALGAAIAGVLGLGFGVKMAADIEMAEEAFSIFLDDAKKARTLIADIQQMAALTPLQDEDIRGAARRLLAFSTPVEELMPTLGALGDIAAGAAVDIKELARILGQGRLFDRFDTRDLRELADRGVPILSELDKILNLGGDGEKLRKMIEKGMVGYEHVIRAIANLTEGDGKFADVARQLSKKTTFGLFTTAKDNFKLLMADIGKILIEELNLKGFLKNTISFFQRLRSSGLSTFRSLTKKVREMWTSMTSWLTAQWQAWGKDAVRVIWSLPQNMSDAWQLIKETIRVFWKWYEDRAEVSSENTVRWVKWIGSNFTTAFKGILRGWGAMFEGFGEVIVRFMRAKKDFLAGNLNAFEAQFDGFMKKGSPWHRFFEEFRKAAEEDGVSLPDLLEPKPADFTRLRKMWAKLVAKSAPIDLPRLDSPFAVVRPKLSDVLGDLPGLKEGDQESGRIPETGVAAIGRATPELISAINEFNRAQDGIHTAEERQARATEASANLLAGVKSSIDQLNDIFRGMPAPVLFRMD